MTAQLLGVYWIVGGFAWLALTVLAMRLRPGTSGDPKRVGGSWVIILLVAAAARAAAVLASPPVFSDDLWRYIHDGATLGLKARNPYAQSPDSGGTALPVNHPHLVTIYQPTSQWTFALLARAAHAFGDGPDEARTVPWGHRTFRFAFAVFDLIVIMLLLVQLRRVGRSCWWAALYAWHPLVVVEIASSGHQDVLGMACLLLALVLLDRRGGVGRAAWSLPAAGCALALSIGVKPLVAPLLLPVVWTLKRRRRGAAGFITAALLTLAALYLPFIFMPGGIAGMVETIGTFMADWFFNGSAHEVLRILTGSKTIADHVCGAMLLAVLILATLTTRDLWRLTIVYLLGGLLLSSTVHPWYLLWALVLVPIRFSAATWIFSLTIGWSYIALVDPDYSLPVWLRWAEYLPVYAALLCAMFDVEVKRLPERGAD